jgi:hypothetical protein
MWRTPDAPTTGGVRNREGSKRAAHVDYTIDVLLSLAKSSAKINSFTI